jgi:hypothetical protein
MIKAGYRKEGILISFRNPPERIPSFFPPLQGEETSVPPIPSGDGVKVGMGSIDSVYPILTPALSLKERG